MFLTDDESGELKKWVVKRLEDISDADSDVLADYVLALIRADTPDEDLKKNAMENLEDFLRDNTAGFVNAVFAAINERSYMPGYVPPRSTNPRVTPFDTAPGHTGDLYSPLDARRGLNGDLNLPRKRSYNDRLGDGDGNDLQYGRNDRSVKQMRRGGRGGRGDSTRGDYFGGRGGRTGGPIEHHSSSHGIPGLAQSPPIPFPGMAAPPPGFPFDHNDPMGAIMAMQAMGFPPLPGMPTFPQGATSTGLQQLGDQLSPGAETQRMRKPGVRCRDYDTKGFCARGSSCPYEHGMDHIVVPGQQEEYDPKNSVMVDIRKTVEGTNGNGSMNNNRGSDRGRGRGRGRGDGGPSGSNRRGRADFSYAGPNHDRSISTIVVEQIPEEKFDETSVRDFFSQFGNILEVTMQPYKRLAVVKYDDYGAARRAYESPKVIFENRFVKVYWYKPDALPTPPGNHGTKAAGSMSPTSKTEEKPFDREQFERDSAAAQKRLEEKQKKLKETEVQRQALEKQKEELAKMQQEEKKKLLEKLAAKGAGKANSHPESATAENGTSGTGDSKVSAQTEALRAQLAALEAEARSLGLDTTLTDDSTSYRGRGRGRGIHRGWGSFPPRGRGFDPSRGAYRGRGASFGGRGGGVYKLDNRTKKVAVSGAIFDSAKDEGLRQYLLGIGEFENIEANPDRKDSQVITFKDRFTAEKLMYGSTEIPSVGKVEFAWINTPLPPATATAKAQDGDTHMADHEGTAVADGARTADVDYDVAEDDDRWLAEYTASFAFFEAIWEAGITHCFVNLGSDHPSIIEAMVKGQNEKKGEFPKIITCPNEMVALSMADGYARLTNKPQCVIVHVDVGTQGLGAAVHNASCGRAPVLIFAGLSPFTIEGEMRGSRTEYIHWIQDVPDQKQIVAQYCRYTGEIKTGKNVKQMVNRALSFAMSDPKGPVYLVGAREAMEEDLEPYHLEQAHWRPIEPAALSESAVKQIAEALVEAKEPLVITGYSGRNHASVPELVKLTETIKGLRVLDTGGSDMCFPADHRASVGVRYGVDSSIETADVILVVDCDVPWINTQCHPKKDAKIFHIDVDPLKQQMPVFYIAAMARFRADSCTSFTQLHTYIHDSASLSEKASGYTDRWEKLATQHQARLQTIAELAQPGSDGNYNVSYLTACVRKAVPEDTIFCIEAVTNTAFVADQIQASLPGSWINCGGGGLGWSGGGALGLKMATDAAGEGKFVCQIVGDGTFLFSVPGSVYWIAQRYKIPTLTIVLNNQGWNAPRRSLLLVHPHGAASKVTNEEMNISFAPTPDYAGIAKAAAGGNLWAERASTVQELHRLLPLAVQSVLSGKGAVLDAHLDGPQGKFGGGVGGASG